MLHATGLRAIVGKPRGRRLAYLAAALALHAWMRRGSSKRGATGASDGATGASDAPERGRDDEASSQHDARDERDGDRGRVEAHAPGSTPSEAFGGYNDRSVEAACDRQAEPADRWRPSPSMGGDREPAPDASASGGPEAPVGGSASSDESADAEREDGGAGITDLAPSDEHARQSSLPPRGQRKPGYHA